jgi:cytochrome c oxidase cbb3-type subunit 3
MNARALAAILLVGSVGACAAPDAPGGDQAAMSALDSSGRLPLTEAQQRGRVIYETMCWTCHGESGRGDGPAVEAGTVTRPPSFHTLDYARSTAETLERRFRVGVGGVDASHPHMQYVASILQPEHFADALSYISALSYPTEIPGSALAGEKIFSFRCAACHGEDGRGRGRAAPSLVAMAPADFTTDTLIAKRDWDALYNRITEGGRSVHGSSMPPWGIVLGENDIWDVIAYLALFQPGAVRPPYWLE